MSPVYFANFLGHLTLALDWMAASLGLWGYLREMDMGTDESSSSRVQFQSAPPHFSQDQKAH